MERSGTEILNSRGWRDGDETTTRIWDLEKNSDENFGTTLGQVFGFLGRDSGRDRS